MRLAVFTSKFPSQVCTFFARDMRGLLETGVEIDIFPLYPEDRSLWRFVPAILSEKVLPRERVHYTSGLPQFGPPKSWESFQNFASGGGAAVGDALATGLLPTAKTAYAWLKSWNWGREPWPRFDHVLGYWGNYAATAAYLFCRLRGGEEPFSIFLHAGTDLYRDPIYLRQKLAAARHVLVCTDFNRRYLAEAFPDIAPEVERKLFLHQHGLDLEELHFEVDGRTANRVVGVGGLQKGKGFDSLIRICRILRDRGVPIDVELVGDGPQREPLERLSRDLGLESHVRFRGWLPFVEARESIRRAAVLVHPSAGLGDGAPNVIKEAMALGTPVVASAVAGIPDLLEGGRAGLLVPPKDPEALASAVGTLLADAPLRRAVADRARQSAEACFDLWKNGRALADVLRDRGAEVS